jgi:hypothetical protein
MAAWVALVLYNDEVMGLNPGLEIRLYSKFLSFYSVHPGKC